MLKRKADWPHLAQLFTGGVLTLVIALILKSRDKTLATNDVYPAAGQRKADAADDTLDQLWLLDLDRQAGLISPSEYDRTKAQLLGPH